MGGHGGLNILPQKKWNVYKLRQPRKSPQGRRSRRQRGTTQARTISQLRLDILRRSRGLDPDSAPPPEAPVPKPVSESKHINLFEGIKILDPVMVGEKKRGRIDKELEREKRKMKKKEEEVRVVGPEDEKYRFCCGKNGGDGRNRRDQERSQWRYTS